MVVMQLVHRYVEDHEVNNEEYSELLNFAIWADEAGVYEKALDEA